ncbi:PREDICTED: UDP-glucuronosyltransferase 2C1-like [Nicrophorus vespilloides]|uniref:UDP-glucuronosyltransferase n=1 Tax=Nicrophorus vespilloides TaxID=110193 RepID=A0ABM1M9U7_NICVS|nr:PREDICTED: UDP-glucuronosyltransferase 2C1-like [Nicrophorus vespilloides]
MLLHSILLIFAATAASGARILGVFAFPSHSHAILGSALLRELASRGHEVTMISPFPLKNPPPNYNDVHLDGLVEMRNERLKEFMSPNCSSFSKIGYTYELLRILNDDVLENKNLQDFLATKPKFDVAIQMWALNEALLGISNAVNATSIAFSVIGGSAMLNYVFGNPSPYAYVPHFTTTFKDSMLFWQRVVNTLVALLGDVISYILLMPYQKSILQKHFPVAPPLEELLDNVDLALVNSHFITEMPRPYLPNSIQIGGFHLHEKQHLPEDLQTYFNESKHGVFYFSLGTNIKSEELNPSTMEGILRAFSKSKYDVLWKFDGKLLYNPKNVKTAKWLPQKGILAHPKTVAFITHGGFGSITEAIFHGVPMIAIPFFGDQQKNVAETAQRGFAIQLQLKDISEETLSTTMEEISGNSVYRDRIRSASDIFKNQPMNPMEKAVFWVEHIVKHKGAKHMKIKKMPWYQYMLLDVFAFILTILSVFFLFIYLVIKLISSLIKRKVKIQ